MGLIRSGKLLYKLPALLISGIIWFLSSRQVLPTPKGILGFDKVQHLLAYLVLAMTVGLWFSLHQWTRRPWRCAAWVVAIAVVYGISDELHQTFVPGRDGNVWDWVADTLGALIGTGLVMLSARKLGSMPRRS
ncbi:MAG: VanZ family protein [Spirochaetaceae bacterium]|jgi:VanZ family protein|nr:VanZ family protein [Spirochaetaceae bacterium]